MADHEATDGGRYCNGGLRTPPAASASTNGTGGRLPNPAERARTSAAPEAMQPVWLVDSARHITATNEPAARLTGHAADTLVGRPFESLLYPAVVAQSEPPTEGASRSRIARIGLQHVAGHHVEVDVIEEPLAGGVTLITARHGNAPTPAPGVRNEASWLRHLFDTVPDLVWLKDSAGVYLACNRAFEVYQGAAEADIIGKTDDDFAAPAQAELYRRWDREAIAQRHTVTYDMWLQFHDGTTRRVEITKAPMLGAAGELLGVLGVGRDITTSFRAREVLEGQLRLKEQLEHLAAAAPGVICSFRLDSAGRASIPYASPRIRDLFGRPPEALRQDASEIWAAVHPADLLALDAAMRESARTLTVWRTQFRVIAPNRGERWAECHLMPQAESDGGVLWHGFLDDVTEQKAAEQALQKEAERRRILFEQSTDGIVVLDEDFQIVEANARFAEMLGYPMEELVELHVWDIDAKWTREELVKTFGDYRRPQETFETRHRRKDGSPLDVEITAYAAEIDGRIVRFNIVRDISRRKAADDEIRRVSQLYLTLSKTNEAIVRATTDGELLDLVCAAASEHGQFALATVLLLAPDGRLRVAAAAGPARGYVDGLDLCGDGDVPEGQGPAGTAIRSGAHVICNDFQSNPLTQAWQQRAKEFGIEAAGAFPLVRDGTVVGLFGVYSTIRAHFGEREVALLNTMAADISLGLASLERARALESSLEKLQQSMDQLEHIEQAVGVGVFRLSLPSRTPWWSEGMPAVLGLRPGTTPTRVAFEAAFQPEIAEMLRAELAGVTRAGDSMDVDVPLVARGDPPRWVRVFGVGRRHGEAELQIVGTVQDITERKRLESEIMRAANGERQRLASELHDNLGQILTAISFMAVPLAERVSEAAPALTPSVERLATAVREACQVCRTVAHGASPMIQGGLSDALRVLVEQTEAAGVRCTARLQAGVESAIPGFRAAELYRIAQEAVTNSLRHAHCQNIEVTLARHGDGIDLVIRDDGVGLDLSRQPAGGLGLRTMRYRATQAGGTLMIRARPGLGTTVRVFVPSVRESTGESGAVVGGGA